VVGLVNLAVGLVQRRGGAGVPLATGVAA
jgi:hypothetical protein